MPTWQQFPENEPPEGPELWIRYQPESRPPVLATWENGTKLWTLAGTDYQLPWYLVTRWREQ